MRIKEITYGLTVNLGNYESVRIDMTAEVAETEFAHVVYDALRKEVCTAADFERLNAKGKHAK